MPFNIKSSGSFYATFDDSPLSSNRTYILPNTGGVLITSTVTGSFPFSSSYALTASYAISTATYQVDIYDSTSEQSTWTKPSWAQSVTVIAIGGGGGGGAGSTSSNTAWFKSGGGGGAGGEIVWNTYRASDLPSSVSIQVGAGGSGGAGDNLPGNQGGNSRFGSANETSYTVLCAQGGFPGRGGVASGQLPDVSVNMARPGAGKPASSNSTGAGAGGHGVCRMTMWGPQGASALPESSGSMRLADAPNLPYTVNDCYLQSFRWFDNPTNVGNLILTGVPSAVAPTGGGGGMGGNTAATTSSPVHVLADDTLPERGSRGGSILSASFNRGNRTTAPTENLYATQGVIMNSVTASFSGQVLGIEPILQKYIQYVKVGLGGGGGWTQGAAHRPAQTGSKYGGGGGGGRYNTAGAAGGSGAIIVISEA